VIEDLKKDVTERMQKALDALQNALARVRTGRAHPSLLDSVMVNYYGSPTHLNQIAQIGVEDGRTLTVRPFERSTTPDIDKAIRAAGLGLNPATSGDLIRIPMPALTEETRRNMAKIVKQEAEHARISVRNIRRDANAELKEFLKEKEINEDQERQGEEAVQKLTDQFVAKIASMSEKKEADLMEI
jgi:ribosome recycling factor